MRSAKADAATTPRADNIPVAKPMLPASAAATRMKKPMNAADSATILMTSRTSEFSKNATMLSHTLRACS